MAELVVLVIEDGEKLDQVSATWRDLDVRATVIESAGMRRLAERLTMDDVPLFPSLARLTRGEETGQKTLFAVVRDAATVETLIARTTALLGNLDEPGTGILFTLPVTRVVGLR